jgi:phage shock protein C
MIGGVCNGMAVYFDVDVTIIRLIFAALALASGGIMVVAYFVMMFLIPEARTPEEQASAFGMPFNAQEVIDQVKSQINDFKDNKEEWKKEWKKKWKAQERYWKHRGPAERFNGIHPLAGFFLLFFAMIFGIWLIGGIIRTFTVAVFAPTMIGAPPWVVLVLFIVGLNFLFWVIAGGRRRDGPSPLRSLVGGVAQIFLLLILIGFAYNVFPFVREIVDSITIIIYRLIMTI